MFGRLSQLAQNVQNSFNADESGEQSQSGGPSTPSKGKDGDPQRTIALLQADLEQAEERNKSVNMAFKKLLKEKEDEIKSLKQGIKTSGKQENDGEKESKVDVDTFYQLKRKAEESQMLIEQKDQTIQILMAEVKEAEDLRDKVEQQERINTEKLMHELATRIQAHESIQRKLEETKHVMTEKDNAIHNMADQMAAQDELLRAKEDSIKKLKRMATGGEASEEMIVTLQKAVQEKDNRLSQMAQLIDKLEVEKKLLDAKIDNRDGLETSKDQFSKFLQERRTSTSEEEVETVRKESADRVEPVQDLKYELEAKRQELIERVMEIATKGSEIEKSQLRTIKTLWGEIEQKNEIIQKLSAEKEELAADLQKKEQEVKIKADAVSEKESVVNELVIKVRSLERELSLNKSDIEVSSEGATREIGHLKNQISEFNEILKSKTQTIDMFQKEIDEKDSIQNELRQKLASLQGTVCENENQLQSLGQKCKQIEKERDEYKEKYETEASEKGMVKEQLDKVGSELSQQLDQETQKVADLMSKLTESEETASKLAKENENLTSKLATCQDNSNESFVELEKLQQRVEALENEVEGHRKEAQDRLAELQRVKGEVDVKGEELKVKEKGIEAASIEIERLQQRMETLETETEAIREEARERVTELDSVKGELDIKDEELKAKEKEIEEMKIEIERSQQRLESLEKEVEAVSKESANRLEKVETLEEELEAKRQELNERVMEIATNGSEIEKSQLRVDSLEKEVDALKGEISAKSEEVLRVKDELKVRVEELEVKGREVETKNNEIQAQRERFDAELKMLQNASESEKGNAATLLQEMENVRRELEATSQIKRQVEAESQRLKVELEGSSDKLKEIKELLTVSQSENEILKGSVRDFEVESQRLKTELAGRGEELEQTKRLLTATQNETDNLKKSVKDFEEKVIELDELKTMNVTLHNELLGARQNSEQQISSLKSEYITLGGNVKEMEAAMNHMVEKLNSAELKMNESMQEKESLEEKLRLIYEERSTLASQKYEIETALDEFVKATESRKRRSGRSSVEDEAARLTPNEGSGYSTPISKEGSPRNSAYLEVYQPPIQPSVVGSAFEGKAVSEIFRLVEEERKSLEANLASLTKERDALAVRCDELEDYLELEKQKFKQASDEISQVQQQALQMERQYADQMLTLQDELSSLMYAKEEYETKIIQDAETIEDQKQNNEKLESDLRRIEDQLADKALELSRLVESSDKIQTELGSREEQLEKVSKQNSKMKSKLKELLKERSEKDALISDKQARLDELEGIIPKLKEATESVERLEAEVRAREAKIAALEEEGLVRSSEMKSLVEKVIELEEDAQKVKEMSASEIYMANEKTAELEKSFRDNEDVKVALERELKLKSKEVEDLGNILDVQKEEIVKIKEILQQTEGELVETKSNLDDKEGKVSELVAEVDKIRAALMESETTVGEMQTKLAENDSRLEEISVELESQKEQNVRQIGFIAVLEEDLYDLNVEASKLKEDLVKFKEENLEKSNSLKSLENQVTELKSDILRVEAEKGNLKSENEAVIQKINEDLASKEKEIASLVHEREGNELRLKELEEMLVGKDAGLNEIVESKNKEVASLKEENRALHTQAAELQGTTDSVEKSLSLARNMLEELTAKCKQVENELKETKESKESELGQKLEEIERLEAECQGKSQLLEELKASLEELQSDLEHSKEQNEKTSSDAEILKVQLESLQTEVIDLRKDNNTQGLDLEKRIVEIEELTTKLHSQSAMTESFAEEMEKQKEAFENQLRVIQGDKNEGESQLIDLTSQLRELTSERDNLSKKKSGLEVEIVDLNKRVSELEGSVEFEASEKNSLKQKVNELSEELNLMRDEGVKNSLILDATIQELDQKIVENEEATKTLSNEKQGLLARIENREESLQTLQIELDSLKATKEKESTRVNDLERSISEKDQALKELGEMLQEVRTQERNASEERQNLAEQLEEYSQKYSALQDEAAVLRKQTEDAKKQTEQCDQEFEAERDIFAAKISELNSEIEKFKLQEQGYVKEIEILKSDISKKEDLVALKSEEFGSAKKAEEALSEEIENLKAALLEKEKKFEEYKGKVLKKMKSMKEETKKQSAESEKAAGQTVEILRTEISEAENRIQALTSEIAAYKHKIFDMENLNLSREENLRNFETEMTRYHSIVKDKSDEVAQVKEMMRNTMEELQNAQVQLQKKEDKIKVLQDQLIANEDDFAASFTEKEIVIEELREVIGQLEVKASQGEAKSVELSTSLAQYEDATKQLAELESARKGLADELQRTSQAKDVLEAEKSRLLGTVEQLKIALESKDGDTTRLLEELERKESNRSQLLEELERKEMSRTQILEELQRKDADVVAMKEEISTKTSKIELLTSELQSRSQATAGENVSELCEVLKEEKRVAEEQLDALAKEHQLAVTESREKQAELDLIHEQLAEKCNEVEKLKAVAESSSDEEIRPYVQQISELQAELDKKKKNAEEFKVKASKRLKTLKEENTTLNSTIEDLNTKLEEQQNSLNQSLLEVKSEKQAQTEELRAEVIKQQEKIDESMSEVEEYKTIVQMKAEESENFRTEVRKLKQRLGDKEEEVLAVKEMMQNSMNEMQAMGEQLANKEGVAVKLEEELSEKQRALKEIEEDFATVTKDMAALQEKLVDNDRLMQAMQKEFKCNEDSLNASLLSTNEELSALKEELSIKMDEQEVLQREVDEASEKIQGLRHELEAKSSEFDKVKERISGEVVEENRGTGDVSNLEEARAEVERESEAIKLKLAKAIKRMGTLKKESLAKDEIVRKLQEELDIANSKLLELSDQRAGEPAVDKNSQEIAKLTGEIMQKDQTIDELEKQICSLRLGREASETSSVSELVVPSAVVGVAAETPGCWGDIEAFDAPDGSQASSSRIQPVVEDSVKPVEAVEVATESIQDAASENIGDNSLVSEIDRLKIQETELNAKLAKSNELLEKAKKKLAYSKKAEIKTGKDNDLLKVQLEEANSKLPDLLSKVSDLSSEVTQKEAVVKDFESEVKSLQNDLNQASQARDKMKATNEDLKRLLEVMAEEKHELDDEMKEMLGEIKDVMDIKNKLLKDLDNSNEKLAKAEEDYQNLSEILRTKEAEVVANEWKLQEMEALETEVAELRDERFKINAENSQNFKQMEELKKSASDKDHKVETLEAALTVAQKSLTEKEELMEQLRDELKDKEKEQDTKGKEEVMELMKIKAELGESLKAKEEDLEKLAAANAELHDEIKDLQARIEEDLGKMQADTEEMWQQKSAIGELENELLAKKDELAKALKVAGETKREVETLKEKLENVRRTQSDLREEIVLKNAELEEMKATAKEQGESLKKQLEEEKSAKVILAEEVRSLQDGINKSVIDSDNERSLLSTTIEELKLSASQKEDLLCQEIALLKEKAEKERILQSEQSKLETEEIVRAVDDRTHEVANLQADVQKLNASLEHKDTIIGKLKLKLKQKIKDRDVMQGNLQSEIERISHEKDVIFNEFQAKVQETENEILNLRAGHSELERQEAELKAEVRAKEIAAKEMEERIKSEMDELTRFKEESVVELSDLKNKIASLETECQTKDESIEKYEWENSEKEDKIRELEREARFFDDKKHEWEELKKTLEDTLDVKDKIMAGLQKEVEDAQRARFDRRNAREEEMLGLKEERDQFQEQLRLAEERLNISEEERSVGVEKLDAFEKQLIKICDVFGVDHGVENRTDQSIIDALLGFKESFDKNVSLYEEKLTLKEDQIMKEEALKAEAQEELQRLKEEQDILIETALLQSKREETPGEAITAGRSLKEVLDSLISAKDDLANEVETLGKCIQEEQEAKTKLEIKLQEKITAFEDFKGLNHEEQVTSLNEQLKDMESKYLEAEEKSIVFENDCVVVKRSLADREKQVEELSQEKGTFELKLSEIETSLDLARLATQQVQADKDNATRQLEIMIQESEALKSSTLPEMQALISSKNTAMFELRENFSEVISDKDSIISTLRTKISDLQHQISEGNSKNQEDVIMLKAMLSQRDEKIDKLSRDIFNAKKNRDWLQTELSQTIKDKNNIGGSIQNQFENISKGLRGDIEMFMEDKKAYETELHLERLQLEKSVAEKQQEVVKLEEIIAKKDEEILQLNVVMSELRLRVESAADILSKEGYYQQLEERVEESYEEVKEANSKARLAEDKLRMAKTKVHELEMKLDLSNRERGEIVLVYEAKLQKVKNDDAKVLQSLKGELEHVIQEKRRQVASLQDGVEEAIKNTSFIEERMAEEFAVEKGDLNLKIAELAKAVEKLKEEKEELRQQIMSEVLQNAGENMLKLQNDYEAIIYEKESVIEQFSSKIEELEEKVTILTDSNTNLSKNLFALEMDYRKLRKELLSLEDSNSEVTKKHKEEVDDLLVSKGKDFKELRSQFEEAFGEKEQVVENLRTRVKELSDKIEEKFQENNMLSSQKEELIQQDIKRDLLSERLKVTVDSLLNSISELADGAEGQQRIVPGRKQDAEVKTAEERIAQDGEHDQGNAREKQLSEFAASINEAKIVVESFIRSRNAEKLADVAEGERLTKDAEAVANLKRLQENFDRLQTENEGLRLLNSELTEKEKLLREEQENVFSLKENIMRLEGENTWLQKQNAELSEKEILIDQQQEAAENTPEKSDATNTLPMTLSDMIGVPRVISGLQILATESNKEEEYKESAEVKDIEKDDISSGKVVTEDIILPESSVTLDTANEGVIDNQVVSALNEEISVLKSQIAQLENSHDAVEMKVRTDFDDILQNLREDLQNAMNENRSLMAENFMLKNIGTDEKSLKEKDVRKADTESQTEDSRLSDAEFPSDTLSLSQNVVTDSRKHEAFAQTDVSFVYQNLDDSLKRGENTDEARRVKRLSGSERLPEIVEDTLYSNIAFDQLQTFSDSALEADSFAGHGKLELRISDQEDGDKSINIADLQSEVEGLNSKIGQSKRLIVKLKQMSKKYKTELSELQAEKFEQVRVYEDAINLTKQELEECCLEKVRKDQEIRGLREEVRVLVKEKADMADSVKARIDEIRENHSKVIADLAAKNDQEFAKKEEIINALYNLKDESQGKIDQLENQVSFLFREKSSLEEKLQNTIDKHAADEEVTQEELERKDIELKEAFELIRAMEQNQLQLEEDYESQRNEMSSIIEAKDGAIEQMTSERVEAEKQMQEMREAVQNTVEEKNSIVDYWKTENNKIIEENERRFTEKIQISQMNIEECQNEITLLRNTVDTLNGEAEDLQARLENAEDIAKDLGERNEEYRKSLEDAQGELERALQGKSLAEDKLAFFEHQVEGMQAEHQSVLSKHRSELEQARISAETLKTEVSEKNTEIERTGSEMQSLKDEVTKGKKKVKRLKRELDATKRDSQELAEGIRMEMEKVVDALHEEKMSLYSEVLSKDSQLQEARIHADQLVKEKEQWTVRMRTSGSDETRTPRSIETDILVGNSDIEMGFTDKERLNLQIQQLRNEKDQIVANLEEKITGLRNDYCALEKSKREQDLKTAELTAKLAHKQREDTTKGVIDHKQKLQLYGSEVKTMRGEFEMLKKEASGFADASKMLLGQLESELTGMILNAAQVQQQQQEQDPQQQQQQQQFGQLEQIQQLPLQTAVQENLELRSLSPDIASIGSNSELEEAKERISMLEDSLRTWQERCNELEEQLQQRDPEILYPRRGSQEFLINIDDDQGPSIESARPAYGSNAQRLMKYSTSGMQFKTRARSFLTNLIGRQRGKLPAKRLLLMVYLLAIHALAFVSLYGFLSG